MKNKTNKLLIIVCVILVIALIATIITYNQEIKNQAKGKPQPNQNKQKEIIEKYENLKFSEFKITGKSFVEISPQDLKELLSQTNETTKLVTGERMAMDMAAAQSFQAEESFNSPELDYSGTNVQVQDIDEGDVVKTNGEKIFIAKENKIKILDVETQQVTQIEIEKIENTEMIIKEILIDEKEDLLYVVVNKTEINGKYTKNSLLQPRIYTKNFTIVKTYNINQNTPQELNSIEINGEPYQTRFKNGVLYIITNKYVYDTQENDDIIIPLKQTIGKDEFYFQPKILIPYHMSKERKVIYNISSIKYSQENSIIDSIELVLESYSTIYMSHENLYITTKDYLGMGLIYGHVNDLQTYEIFKEIYKEIYPSKIVDEIKKEIENVDNVIEILNNYYQTLTEKQRNELFNKIDEQITKYTRNKFEDLDKTKINKIELKNNGEFGQIYTGEVQGNLLNQFSLDEKDGYLRVATTYMDFRDEYNIKNNSKITILDEKLKKYSELKDISFDESIKSVRFLENKLYLVTYRNVDPFFVIDLEDHKNPKILGFLKITGYSDYLHPIEDNLIIGVGRETKESEDGTRVNDEGVKVSLFDISDLENPIELAKWVSEVYGYTPIAHDHKAFLYIKKNNQIVIPIETYNVSYDTKYTNEVFAKIGFIMLEIKDRNLLKINEIEHELKKEHSYYTNIKRSLYIGNELYTITNNLIKKYNLETNETTEINI